MLNIQLLSFISTAFGILDMDELVNYPFVLEAIFLLSTTTSPNKGRAVDLIYSNKNSFLMTQVSSPSMRKERGIHGILHLFHFHTL